MPMIFVVPKTGLMVPDPAMRGPSRVVRLPAEGKLVEDGAYWQRRLRDGDVELRTAPAASAPESGKKADK
jgi:hypothetical protein